MIGDLLRVVKGADVLRQGQLEQKISKGAALYLRDLQTKELVSRIPRYCSF
jgi:hypothetical protein